MNHAQKNISTQPPAPGEDPRLPAADANPGGTSGAGAAAEPGTAAAEREARLPRLNPSHLPPALRLRRRAEYTPIYRLGKRLALPHFQLIGLPPATTPGPPLTRFGITVPRKAGNAVERNRMRRRTRVLLAQLYTLAPAGWQIVVHPRSAMLDEDFAQLRGEMEDGLRRLAARAPQSR